MLIRLTCYWNSLICTLLTATLLLLICHVNGKEGIPSSKPSSDKPHCAKVSCTTPPEGLKCNKTEIKNPGLLKKVGKLKDCCVAWRCQEEDGSFSTYFGMSGVESVAGEKKKKKDKKKEEGKKSTTEKTPQSTDKSTEDKCPESKCPLPSEKEDTSEDKCAEAKAQCPLPGGKDKCSVTSSKDAMQFKPKGELDSCCPIYNCTDESSYRLLYLMKGGEQPKKASTISKEKGTATEDKKCPSVQCAQEPVAGEDGPICEKSSEHESERIKGLGKFRECCEMWKCAYLDGSFYTHFELQATSFWLAETVFQSEATNPVTTTMKPVSGDDVEEALSDVVEKQKKKAKEPEPTEGEYQVDSPPLPPEENQLPPQQMQMGQQSGSNFQNSYSSSYASGNSWNNMNSGGSMMMPPQPQMMSVPIGPPGMGGMQQQMMMQPNMYGPPMMF